MNDDELMNNHSISTEKKTISSGMNFILRDDDEDEDGSPSQLKLISLPITLR
jgi:hypothetical protein